MPYLVPAIAIIVALVTYTVGYLMLFEDSKHFLTSIGRLVGIGILEELFPGYVGTKKGRLRALLWIFSGILTGTIASLVVRYLTSSV